MFLFSIFPFITIAIAQSPKAQPTCYRGKFGLNYMLPTSKECGTKFNKDVGEMIQTIPKLIPASPLEDPRCGRESRLGIPRGQRICRFPDCLLDPCVNGWCEETMTYFTCHCPPDLTGIYCETSLDTSRKQSSVNTGPSIETKDTMSSATTSPLSVTTYEAPTTTSACFPTPCHNGSTCVETEHAYECDCPDESFGSTCACHVFHTVDVAHTRIYTFPGWYVGNMTSLDFEVSANNDVHVALSNQNREVHDMYEIVLGGYANTIGGLSHCHRRHCPWTVLTTFSTKVLSGIPSYDRFWLSFANGHIQVGRHGEDIPIVEWTDPAPMAINYVGVFTGYGSSGKWKFHSFCPR